MVFIIKKQRAVFLHTNNSGNIDRAMSDEETLELVKKSEFTLFSRGTRSTKD